MSMSNTTKRVKEIHRKTRRKFSSVEKIRIVLVGLRGESSIAELARTRSPSMRAVGLPSFRTDKPEGRVRSSWPEFHNQLYLQPMPPR